MRCLILPFAWIACGFAATPAHADWWCPPGSRNDSNTNPECVFDVPRKQSRAVRDAWFEAARVEAARLPIPYEDLVMAMFSGWKVRDGFCLAVFNAPPSAELTARLRAIGHEPRRCSQWRKVTHRSVYRIRQSGENAFVMTVGSYSGRSGAGEWDVTFTRNPDGTFAIKEDLIWIS